MDWLNRIDPFTLALSLLLVGMGVSLVGMWLSDDGGAAADADVWPLQTADGADADARWRA